MICEQIYEELSDNLVEWLYGDPRDTLWYSRYMALEWYRSR